MTLIGEILAHSSLSIVGMEKNTGKTETLNYILRNIPPELTVAVTSLGTDGEKKDIVTNTGKPEIELREGMIFSTSEKYYSQRRLVSELLKVSDIMTAAGRIVTSRALSRGKVILSGPPTVAGMRKWRESLDPYGVCLTIMDGALSRVSSASPAVSEAMILATGAAFSHDVDTLVRETAYRTMLASLPLAGESRKHQVEDIPRGIWCLASDGRMVNVVRESSLSLEGIDMSLLEDSQAVYIAGALTERFLSMLLSAGAVADKELIVKDFTKIFVSSRTFKAYLKAGGRIKVLYRSRIIALTVNPTSPRGMVMDTELLQAKLAEATGLPVYDIMRCG